MKANLTRKTRTRPVHPLAKLDLRILVSQEEILADLQYPATARTPRRRP
jgi:hypothetical protein